MAGLNGCMLASALCFFAFAILYLVSFGSPYWVATTEHNWRYLGFKLSRLGPGSSESWMMVNFGLWVVCGQTRSCRYWTSIGDAVTKSLRSSQVVMCIGLLSLFGAIGAYVWWILNQYRVAARRLAVTLCICTGLCALVSVCIFADFFKRNTTVLGWGYWNTVLCAIGLLLTGILTACTLLVMPIGKAPPPEEQVEKPKKADEEKGASPAETGSENPAYLATPGNEPEKAEDLNSSIAGSSVAGYGIPLPPLIPKVPVGAFGEQRTVPLDQKPEEQSKYFSQQEEKPKYFTQPSKEQAPVRPLSSQSDQPDAEPQIAFKPAYKSSEQHASSTSQPQYYSSKQPDQESKGQYPYKPSTSSTPQYMTQGSRDSKPQYLTQSSQESKPQYLTQPPQDSKPQYLTGSGVQPQYPYMPQQSTSSSSNKPQYPYRPRSEEQDQPQYLFRPQAVSSRPTSEVEHTESDV